jgi:hypothetical protein
VTYLHLFWTEGVPFYATEGRLADPLPARGLHHVAQHLIRLSVTADGGAPQRVWLVVGGRVHDADEAPRRWKRTSAGRPTESRRPVEVTDSVRAASPTFEVAAVAYRRHVALVAFCPDCDRRL